MARILSGIQPSGALHLGNYLGAVRQWAANQSEEAFYCVVDLHAMTLEIAPEELRLNTLDTAVSLLAAGIDPARCNVFVQSHVPAHVELSWILECTASYGELRRMIQFRDKAGDQESVRVSLLTYPVLMAADILVYQTEQVPVGDDQRQHIELTRDLAIRFNSRYGETFTVPEAVIPKIGARVMDLQHPERKMSKSVSSPGGTILLSDGPDELTHKVRRAVTDTGSEVLYDPEHKPGVSNLLDLLAAATGGDPAKLATDFSNYGGLKAAVAESLVELLRPVQERLALFGADPAQVTAALELGAAKAKAAAEPTLERARSAVGLTPRS